MTGRQVNSGTFGTHASSGRLARGVRGIVLFAGLLAALAIAVAATSADAAQEWRWFSQPGPSAAFPDGCPEQSTPTQPKNIDPVGIVFQGQNAWDGFVDQEMQQRLSATYKIYGYPDWAHGDPGGQYLYWKNVRACQEMTQSMASAGSGDRWHMRVGNVAFDLNSGVYYSLGTPHYDYGVPHCNLGNKSFVPTPWGDWLKGGSFNVGRRVFRDGIRDGGPTGFIQVDVSSSGNTNVRRKGCNGEDVSTNGHVVWVKVGKL
jgi:hypothetical protein